MLKNQTIRWMRRGLRALIGALLLTLLSLPLVGTGGGVAEASGDEPPPRPTPLGGNLPTRPIGSPFGPPSRPPGSIPTTGSGGGATLAISIEQSLGQQGALIRLWAYDAESTTLWTEVQFWEPLAEEWRSVETWQGGFDRRVVTPAGGTYDEKLWWLADDLLGKGPLRWVVYEAQGGAPLLISDSFMMPDFTGQVVTAEVWMNYAP